MNSTCVEDIVRTEIKDALTVDVSSIILSILVYKGSMAYVSERRRPNTANPEGLVRKRYVVGKKTRPVVT
jgi:hypothetical protein